jgi:hypothetical protein
MANDLRGRPKFVPERAVPQLRQRVLTLESAVRQASAALDSANERTALAEKSARDAWLFAKSLRSP